MPTLPRPLASADLSQVIAVFTDVDGTLNTDGILESATIRSLEALAAAKIPVVLVSGRPSGWGDCWMHSLPVAGAIMENGGLYYSRHGGHVRKTFAQLDAKREVLGRRLRKAVGTALKAVPHARLSSDSPAREVDIAFDYNEHARLDAVSVDKVEAILRAKGMNAVRSSVHVNVWAGEFDKLSTMRTFCARVLRMKLRPDDQRIVYVGDSYNDAPAFGGIALSVGVANVRDALANIDSPPKFITKGREGAGFREVAAAVLRDLSRETLKARLSGDRGRLAATRNRPS